MELNAFDLAPARLNGVLFGSPDPIGRPRRRVLRFSDGSRLTASFDDRQLEELVEAFSRPGVTVTRDRVAPGPKLLFRFTPSRARSRRRGDAVAGGRLTLDAPGLTVLAGPV